MTDAERDLLRRAMEALELAGDRLESASRRADSMRAEFGIRTCANETRAVHAEIAAALRTEHDAAEEG